MVRQVWFQLVGEQSRCSFASTAAASVQATADVVDVEDFRHKVHAEFDHTQPPGRSILAHVAPFDLKVYATRAAYDANEEPLDEDSPIDTLGKSKNNALIVEVPAQGAAKRLRTTGNFQGVTLTPVLPPESVDLGPPPAVHNEHYRTVSAALLSKCGLAAPCAGTVLLYCRREVRNLWAYVAQETVVKDVRVFIVGPPGTGKSLSVLCYLTQLDPSEWNVMWIHLGESRDSCLSMGSREYWKEIDLETFVVPRVAGKKLFVCLDGFKDTPTHADCLSRALHGGMTGDRYLVCTSVSTMGRINQEDAERERIRTFYMPSWTRDDYEAAVADATFYEQVASKLDATSDFEVNVAGDEEDWSEAEKKKHALDLKFYYAGGSCRSMFQRTTEQVKQRLQRAVESVRNKTDLVRYCSALWQDDTIDVLYGMADGESGRFPGRFPVSSYAAFLFARASDAETIALLARRL
jgi:hypothetical protein